MTLMVDTFPKVLAAIDMIGQGKLESHACDDVGVSVSTFRHTINTSHELADMYNDAMARGYDRMADQLANIHLWGDLNGVTDPKMLMLISKNRQWLLTKRRPQQYGERSVVEHSITADRTIIEALSQGKQRALAGKILEDVTYTVVSEAVRVHGVEVDPDVLQYIE